MNERIVKLTGQPVSDELNDILKRLAKNEYVSINEINNTNEVKFARSNVDYSRPTIQLENRAELQAHILEKMNSFGSATIDEVGKTQYNGIVDKNSRLDIVIGLPASGKSSAIVDTLSEEFHSKIIDNDEAKKMIPQYNNGWGAGVVHEESQRISDESYYIALQKGENILLPKVGSDYNKLLNYYINPAIKLGYTVNLHYVELDRQKALGRMLNRFIEEGRFLDPQLIDKYCNERDGNKIEYTYEKLKKHDQITGYSKWNNDVIRGEKPILEESHNLEGNYIKNARTEREETNYGERTEFNQGRDDKLGSQYSRSGRGGNHQDTPSNRDGTFGQKSINRESERMVSSNTEVLYSSDNTTRYNGSNGRGNMSIAEGNRTGGNRSESHSGRPGGVVSSDQKVLSDINQKKHIQELKRNGFQPSKDMISKMQQMDNISGKYVGLKEIRDIFKGEKSDVSAECKKIADDIGKGLRAQELTLTPHL